MKMHLCILSSLAAFGRTQPFNCGCVRDFCPLEWPRRYDLSTHSAGSRLCHYGIIVGIFRASTALLLNPAIDAACRHFPRSNCYAFVSPSSLANNLSLGCKDAAGGDG